MRTRYKPAFRRDMRNLRDASMRRRINRKIEELKAATTIREVSNVSRIVSETGRHYRIKIGQYRLGITLEGDTAILDRFGHRSDFYRNFP